MIDADPDPVSVYLELGSKRVFACALDWPGWCRSSRGEEAALGTLADYAARYAPVALSAGYGLPAAGRLRFDVVERIDGSATTDFGAPDRIAAADRGELHRTEAERLSALVAAAWRLLDDVVSVAPPTLRKGPRGGGRDRDAVVQHVLATETAYARRLGLRPPEPKHGDTEAVSKLRAAILSALLDGAPDAPARGWPGRYAARRIAWHVLDHAWEIEDRGAAGPA